MTIRPLSPYRFEQRGSRSVLLLGNLVAEQHLEAVVRIKFGYGEIGSEVARDGALASNGFAPVAIGWQYADDRAVDAEPRDRSVDRRALRRPGPPGGREAQPPRPTTPRP